MIHGMILARNEKTRKLETEYKIFTNALKSLNVLCDRVVALDDNSDDETAEHMKSYDFEVYKSSERLWNKNEKRQRENLWNLTISKAKKNDWIICLDSDEIVIKEHIPYIRYLLNSLTDKVDGIGFKLFDMWSMTHYREDSYWSAHKNYWCMAVRYDERKYFWHNKALHCGRFPANASRSMLPTMIPIKHYGWALEEDRKSKYERYMKVDSEGKNGIIEQYQSILDENPSLVKFGGSDR